MSDARPSTVQETRSHERVRERHGRKRPPTAAYKYGAIVIGIFGLLLVAWGLHVYFSETRHAAHEQAMALAQANVVSAEQALQSAQLDYQHAREQESLFRRHFWFDTPYVKALEATANADTGKLRDAEIALCTLEHNCPQHGVDVQHRALSAIGVGLLLIIVGPFIAFLFITIRAGFLPVLVSPIIFIAVVILVTLWVVGII